MRGKRARVESWPRCGQGLRLGENPRPRLSSVRLRRPRVGRLLPGAEAGILTDRDRVELIDGDIIDTAAIGSPHVAVVDAMRAALTRSTASHGPADVQASRGRRSTFSKMGFDRTVAAWSP